MLVGSKGKSRVQGPARGLGQEPKEKGLETELQTGTPPALGLMAQD